MTGSLSTAAVNDPALSLGAPACELLLQETYHRCSNALQLVVSLLALQSQRAQSAETREALTDAMERVAVLSRSRIALQKQRQPDLEAALRLACEALHSHAEPLGIIGSMRVAADTAGRRSLHLIPAACSEPPSPQGRGEPLPQRRPKAARRLNKQGMGQTPH